MGKSVETFRQHTTLEKFLESRDNANIRALVEGIDLQNLGIDDLLRAETGGGHATLLSINIDKQPPREEFEFQLPPSFYLNPPEFKKVIPETLFYIFYAAVGDVLQGLAAGELSNRGWYFEKTRQLWFFPLPQSSKDETSQPEDSDTKDRLLKCDSWVCFDTDRWSKRECDAAFLGESPDFLDASEIQAFVEAETAAMENKAASSEASARSSINQETDANFQLQQQLLQQQLQLQQQQQLQIQREQQQQQQQQSQKLQDLVDGLRLAEAGSLHSALGEQWNNAGILNGINSLLQDNYGVSGPLAHLNQFLLQQHHQLQQQQQLQQQLQQQSHAVQQMRDLQLANQTAALLARQQQLQQQQQQLQQQHLSGLLEAQLDIAANRNDSHMSNNGAAAAAAVTALLQQQRAAVQLQQQQQQQQQTRLGTINGQFRMNPTTALVQQQVQADLLAFKNAAGISTSSLNGNPGSSLGSLHQAVESIMARQQQDQQQS